MWREVKKQFYFIHEANRSISISSQGYPLGTAR